MGTNLGTPCMMNIEQNQGLLTLKGSTNISNLMLQTYDHPQLKSHASHTTDIKEEQTHSIQCVAEEVKHCPI